MKRIYDPVDFMTHAELFTITMLGSFVTWKFLNALYDNLYEPAIDILIESKESEKYYIKIGDHYVQAGMLVKEFIKWALLIIVLMIFYNFVVIRNK